MLSIFVELGGELGWALLRLGAGIIALFAFFRYGNVGWARGTPISWCHATLGSCLSRLGGSAPAGWVWRQCCESRNPLLAIVYVILVSCGYYVYIRDILPNLPPTSVHAWIHVAIVLVTGGAFVTAVVSDPGRVSQSTVGHWLARYPYSAIFPPNRHCDTCNVPRVPRAKHCRISRAEIARFDHYCPWICNAIGAYNTRWFHAFLMATSAMTGYCAYMTGRVLWQHIERRDMMSWQYTNAAGAVVGVPKRYILAILIRETGLAFPLGVFCSAVSVFVGGFWLYHLYLAATNCTTNESVKWDDLKYYLKWKSKKQLERYEAMQAKQAASGKGRDGEVEEEDDDDQWVLPEGYEPGQVEPMPANVYNKGVWANLKEVFFPQPIQCEKPVPLPGKPNKQKSKQKSKRA